MHSPFIYRTSLANLYHFIIYSVTYFWNGIHYIVWLRQCVESEPPRALMLPNDWTHATMINSAGHWTIRLTVVVHHDELRCFFLLHNVQPCSVRCKFWPVFRRDKKLCQDKLSKVPKQRDLIFFLRFGQFVLFLKQVGLIETVSDGMWFLRVSYYPFWDVRSIYPSLWRSTLPATSSSKQLWLVRVCVCYFVRYLLSPCCPWLVLCQWRSDPRLRIRLRRWFEYFQSALECKKNERKMRRAIAAKNFNGKFSQQMSANRNAVFFFVFGLGNASMNCLSAWQRVQKLQEDYWKRFSQEYVTEQRGQM